ncbi:histone-arginine methyltransferase CARM1 isoform X1 [Pimephales promelas]|uniref:histone-arginine methyltransferase CARM1 isoform X1 n=1 Tax=Pimephales promelas TaxID=90988 RepID=UPI001955B38A|nr:histone-arginine methyltransferase CARM1 isoform X1 [Pimephales promelas]KAG1970996.1 histone-arginine methyltransferase CARM1 [Pimephales promelas]
MGDNQLQSRFSVTVIFLNESDVKRDQHQDLTLHAHRQLDDDVSLTINDDAGVCVFKFSITRETECCRVASRSFLVTLGYFSILIRFNSQSEFQGFHRLLSSWTDLRRTDPSVFQQRTDESSALQYFQFYGCLSQQQNMLQDYLRTATYQKAILLNEVDFKDKVVLDVGCGTGILSFFAVQAGAKRVYAVEASSVAKYAEILVKSNSLSDKITVLSGKIEEVSCPEKVDVIISEPIGYMLLNERMLESFLHAKYWLKPKGMMFPTQSDIHLAPFTDEQLYMEHHARTNFWNQRGFYGVNLSGLHSSALDEFFRQPIVDTFDVQILMARSVKYTINFLEAKEEDLHRLEIPFVFKLLQSGLIHGLAFWFDVAFVGSRMTVWLSTAPNEPLTHWYQVRCLLQTPLFAKMGQTLSGQVHLIANRRQSYDIHITAVVDQSGFKSGNTLDLKNPFFRYA